MTETGMNASNPLDGAAARRHRRPAAARRVDPHRRRGRRRVRAGCGRRHRGEGAERLPRLLADAREDARGVHRRRLFQDRRHGHVSRPSTTCSIVGRAKDLIISGGLNIYPKEIEERIDAIDGVVESAVIGVPDPDFGEAVVAVVVARARASAVQEPGSSRRSRPTSRDSRCRSACTSSPTCRATRWARCRRTCCATGTAQLKAGRPVTARDSPPSAGALGRGLMRQRSQLAVLHRRIPLR